MNDRERQLLREEVGDAEPVLCLRSRAKIDTGRWWRRTPVWLCVVGGELVMLAVGRRRYVDRRKLSEIAGSYYHHPSGELVIEPGEDLRYHHFQLTPREALQLLPHLRGASASSDDSTHSTETELTNPC